MPHLLVQLICCSVDFALILMLNAVAVYLMAGLR